VTRTAFQARPSTSSHPVRGRLARLALATVVAAAGTAQADDARSPTAPAPAGKPVPAQGEGNAAPVVDERRELAFRDFDDKAFVAARKGTTPIVLYFEADWCQPCKEMHATTFREPAVIEAAAGMELFRVDITNSADRRVEILRESFQVSGAPTVIVFASGGREAARRFGFIGANALAEMLAAGRKPPATS
jgi:thiol:disulfide interchange protein